jgi:hypothetical protein
LVYNICWQSFAEREISVNNKPFVIIVAVLLIAIIGVFGFQYLRDMPRISGNDSEKILKQYKADLIEQYNELNAAYDEMSATGNKAGWEEFSGKWIPDMINVRPDVLSEKFPDRYEDTKITLMAAQSDLIPLWTEYNKEFEGKGSDPERIKEFKLRIESALDSVDI